MDKYNKKYTFSFKDKKVIFTKLAHETEFHPFAKALVYSLYHKDYPTIRAEVKMDEERFQPDLNAIDYDGTMLFWAEVGNFSLAKMEKLFKKYRKTHFVFVKEEKDVAAFEKHLNKIAKDMKSYPHVEIIVYPKHFHDWNVSEEGDVFIKRKDVEIISWHEPEGRPKYY
jgi:hypothetical protein